ncbi:MAG: hypothetical protein K8T91_01565 [Planctomycetes bacterium]|nr:hypothetical protein [Planctomycetota bacterium]
MGSILSHTLETLLLAAHFMCVDVAMVGPLGALLLARRARRHNDLAAAGAARWLVQLAWQALATAIVLGLCIGLLLWASGGGRFFTGLMRLPPSRLYFSALELVFYFVLVVPCAIWWESLGRRPWVRGAMLLAASTNLIYHFPGLFVSAAELAAAPPEQTAITSSAFRAMMFTPAVLAQVLHHVLSAVAVVGVAVMLYAGRLPLSEPDVPQPLVGGGARWAMLATLLQVPVGLWLLSTLQPGARGAVLGTDLLTTGLFIAAMVAALALLHFLSGAAMGDTERRQVFGCAAALVIVVLLMTGTLRQIREHHGNVPAAAVGHAQRDNE